MNNAEHNYHDVYWVDGPEPVISYRTGFAVYEESLTRGQWIGRGWNGAGFMNFYDGRLDPQQHFAPQAFWLEIDGQLLATNWAWGGCETLDKSEALTHVVITLKHELRPVTVRVHTLLDGTPVITRWLEVTNTGDHIAALSAAFSWSGVLQKQLRWRSHLPAGSRALYSLGYMTNTHWGNEGDFQWHEMPHAGYRVDGRYRRDRHRHPMFVLRNNATGEHFICQLAWSGGYSFEFDLDADAGTMDNAAQMWFRAGPDAPAPQRTLEAGETITTPQVHLGMLIGDLDASVQAMHDHLRKIVIAPQPRGRPYGAWVESGIGPEIEITPDAVMHSIDMAAEIGAEVFFIDASWYAPPCSHWWNTVGDWQVDLQRFPQGFAPFRDRVHSHGMLWGLWMDAERIAPGSQVAKQHPDWVGTAFDGEKRLGDILDLTNPDAAAWMEQQIARVLEEYECEFFRLDYNISPLREGIRVQRNGYVESGYWRYYEAQYAIYERLRRRFPNVIFENCAGGGGRTDIGMVRRFSHTWITDWQIAPRAFAITNGMSMALPPEFIDRLVGGQFGHSTASYDFQLRLLMFARPTLGLFHPAGATWNPLVLQRTQRFTTLYKEFIRPHMNDGRIYHHTPVVDNPEPKGWGVLELASRDRTRGICGLFQLSSPSEPEFLLRLRGLDASRTYRVTFDNAGETCVVDGYTLCKAGLTVRLESALTSELLIFEAMDV